MTVKTVSVAPEYVSFYISGADDFDVPVDLLRPGVVAVPRCIVVTCLYWNEGDTTITLGPFGELPPQVHPLRLDFELETPDLHVLLSDVHMPEILSMEVATVRTRIRIWTNHGSEPDEVVIGVG